MAKAKARTQPWQGYVNSLGPCLSSAPGRGSTPDRVVLVYQGARFGKGKGEDEGQGKWKAWVQVWGLQVVVMPTACSLMPQKNKALSF